MSGSICKQPTTFHSESCPSSNLLTLTKPPCPRHPSHPDLLQHPITTTLQLPAKAAAAHKLSHTSVELLTGGAQSVAPHLAPSAAQAWGSPRQWSAAGADQLRPPSSVGSGSYSWMSTPPSTASQPGGNPHGSGGRGRGGGKGNGGGGYAPAATGSYVGGFGTNTYGAPADAPHQGQGLGQGQGRGRGLGGGVGAGTGAGVGVGGGRRWSPDDGDTDAPFASIGAYTATDDMPLPPVDRSHPSSASSSRSTSPLSPAHLTGRWRGGIAPKAAMHGVQDVGKSVGGSVGGAEPASPLFDADMFVEAFAEVERSRQVSGGGGVDLCVGIVRVKKLGRSLSREVWLGSFLIVWSWQV